jgi:hypothetical protein
MGEAEKNRRFPALPTGLIVISRSGTVIRGFAITSGRKPAGYQYGFLAQATPSGAWPAMELKQMEKVVSVLPVDYAEREK